MKTKIVNTQDSMEELSLSENIQTISLLDSDKWEKLDTKERLNVLQTVARVERRYLGLPNDLTVKMEDLDDDTKGEYLDSRYEIMISSDSLANDSSWECLDTICHEAYHSYQHRVVEALDSVDEQTAGLRMFRRAKKYAREFDHYDTENFDVYYSQACEKDARDYAEDAVKDYYTKIQEYLNSHQ